MSRGRSVLVTLTASYLVAACMGSGSEASLDPSRPLTPSTESSADGFTTSADLPDTTVAPTTTTPPTTPPTTAAPVTPAPTAAPPTQPVATTPQSAAPKVKCQVVPDPPANAAGLQATYADVDADSRPDFVWLYDAADGTHLHVRTGRGVSDDVLLPFGSGAVAVGVAQVDLSVGAAEPGIPQEIVAVTSGGDGRRLVGIYGFAINTGCLESFVFDQGNPFVYLVSNTGNRSGLRCVSDGVTGHIEALTATPAAGDTFNTTRLVFGRIGRRLVPSAYEAGSLQPPVDAIALGAGSDVTGCALSRPAF